MPTKKTPATRKRTATRTRTTQSKNVEKCTPECKDCKDADTPIAALVLIAGVILSCIIGFAMYSWHNNVLAQEVNIEVGEVTSSMQKKINELQAEIREKNSDINALEILLENKEEMCGTYVEDNGGLCGVEVEDNELEE